MDSDSSSDSETVQDFDPDSVQVQGDSDVESRVRKFCPRSNVMPLRWDSHCQWAIGDRASQDFWGFPGFDEKDAIRFFSEE